MMVFRYNHGASPPKIRNIAFMKKVILLGLLPALVVATIVVTLPYLKKEVTPTANNNLLVEEEGSEGREAEMKASRRRWEYEQMILADPATGKVPADARRREYEATKDIPAKGELLNSTTNQNTYIAAGPNADGGRTRVVVPDVRYNGGTNRVILAAGVSGGIFRSTDNGLSWTWVSPENEIHAVTSIAQDPRAGFQDTWYAGGGEGNGASTNIYTAFHGGLGLLKSTDNGLTWTRSDPVIRDNNAIQSILSTGVLEALDNPFDLVHRIAVNPANGHVYVAGHRRIMRSTDGGANFFVVLGGATPAGSITGQTEVVIKPDGSKIYAGFAGDNPDVGLVGVWESSTGNPDLQGQANVNWTRIAGSNADNPNGWNAPGGWSRIVMAIAPSNANSLYVAYENNSAAGSEIDFFKANLSNSTWSDRSINMSALRNGSTSTPVETQGGYDLHIAVKPNDENTVFVAGVNLFRSSDGFSTTSNNRYLGGYSSNTFSGYTHPDFHYISFAPNDPNRMFVGNDGGVQLTDNCSAANVAWVNLNNNYQTFQYYHVAIDPTQNALNFTGGTQDNATSFRDGTGLLNFLGGTPGSPDDHWLLIGGDGVACGISNKDANNNNRQFLFAGYYEGNIFRTRLFNDGSSFNTAIRPASTGDGLFVTYFHLDNDNTNNLYLVSTDTLYRTTSSSTVNSSTWTRMSGVDNALSGFITSMATSRGGYVPANKLFIGTSNGNVFRLDDPANAASNTAPVNILSPASGLITTGSVVLDIAVNARNHDTVMAVVSNYGVNSIFFTGNATSASPAWQVIDGNISLPSIQSCEIVVKTTGVEYYVGTSVGLFSTTAVSGASTSWVREGAGMMKFAVVRSLAYRWNDNTLLVGTHGNGMFYSQIGNAVNVTTNVNEPVRNNRDFISKVWPIPANNVINYQIGGMSGITRVRVDITDAAGKLVMRREEGYNNNTLDISRLPAGSYVLTISSQQKNQQKVQPFIKQ
jgi:hypothetical protein